MEKTRIGVDLPIELKKDFQALAQSQGIAMGVLIKLMIVDWVQKNRKD